jgi:hypothetical protein
MEIDLFKALGLLWSRRYFILVVVVTAACIGIGATFFMTPRFTAKTEFLMQANSGKQGTSALGLSSLAGQFGLDMGGNQKIFEIFPRVLASRTFLSELKNVPVSSSRDSGTPLGQFLLPRPKANVPLDVQLLDRIRGSIDLGKEKDGVNVLTVKSPDPIFSAFLANTLIFRLEKYYSTLETKKALQNLNFLEDKHRGAQENLAAVGDSLRVFKERNREIVSPALMQRMYWLQMQQRIAEEKYLLLTREFEAAKIDYEKVKPIIVVVDSAIVPFAKSEPSKKLALMVAVVLGGLFSFVWVIAAAWLKHAKNA